MQDQIRKANSQKYGHSQEVDAYLREEYHALRSSIAVNLLVEQILQRKHLFHKIRIIELAASSGAIAEHIQDQIDSAVIASDIEHLPLTCAQDFLSRNPRSGCLQLDASTNFPLADASFTGIYMGELIEHLFDTHSLLSECNRILIPQGILVITTPNLAPLQDRIGFLFGKAPRQVNPLHEYLRLHIRPFTCGLLKASLEATGFNVLAVRSNFVTLRLSNGRQFRSRILARLFPTLGGSLVVTASKSSM